jgi:putative ABC transport system permease protein
MNGLLRDLGHTLRALARARGFLAASVLTLALGIGLSTGVLAVAYGVLLRPLPYAEPSRLVAITLHRSDAPDHDIGVPLPQVDEYRRRARAFERIAAHSSAQFTIRGAGEPRSVRGTMVTDGFFDVLGMAAREGTTRDVAAATPAMALSSGFASQLGSSDDWRTRGLTIGASAFSPVAVMPTPFSFPSDKTAIWLPADAVPKVSFFSVEDQRDFHLIARLAPGVTLVQAQEDAARIAGELNAGLTEPRRRFATVRRLDDELRRGARGTVLPFVGGAAVVLLIACANVSGLLVGRSVARGREFAVRRALGAGAVRLLGLSFAEAAVVAFGGWAVGLWLAQLVIRGFTVFGSGAIANMHAVRLDAPVIAASAVMAALVALLSGAAPALRALRSDTGAVLQQTSERTVGGRSIVRSTLVAAQIAMTVVLLVCAGLLMRTVMTILASESGFDQRHALVSRLMLSETVRFNVTDRAAFVERLVSRVRTLPGVVAAGVGSDLPPGGTQLRMTIRVVRENQSEIFALNFSAVTPGYLEAIGARLVTGRLFEDRDRIAAEPVVVISETAARRLFQDRDPLGRPWPVSMPTPNGRINPRVIGVVSDIKYGGLDQEPEPSVFATWERIAPSQAYLVARTHGDPRALASALRQAVRELDPSLPVFAPESLDEVVAGSLSERRLRLELAATFALLALALASVAVWGAVAQGVAERRREIAIRMALGATDARAVRLVVRDGAVLIAWGLASGLVVAALAAQSVRHLLRGVPTFDLPTFAAAAAIAAGLSMLACYAPARRAGAISPAELLRQG